MPKGIPKKGPSSGPKRQSPTGPHALFRHKERLPTSISLTPEGKGLADKYQAKWGVSRSDLFEVFLRKHGPKLTAVDFMVDA